MNLQRPVGWDTTGLDYQLVGIAVQQLWIVGAWALLVAGGVGRITRGLAALAILLSGFVIVNGFYVWPKLLAAAMLLGAAALILTPAWLEIRRSRIGAPLVAALLALAMLSHGSSIFGIIPLAIIGLWRGVPSVRWLVTAAVTAAILYVPWDAYQKYGDPPGNRLTKWMLSGMIGPDSASLSHDLRVAYSRAGVGGALHDKVENFVTMIGGGPMLHGLNDAAAAVEAGHLTTAINDLRAIQYFNLLPTLGLLLIGLVVMAVARLCGRVEGPDWRCARACMTVVGIGAIAWALLLFGNGESRAVIHQGSYLLPILAFCGAVAGLRAIAPRLAIGLLAVNALLTLALMSPSFNPAPGTHYSAGAVVLCLVGLLGFAALALGQPPPLRWSLSRFARPPRRVPSGQ